MLARLIQRLLKGGRAQLKALAAVTVACYLHGITGGLARPG